MNEKPRHRPAWHLTSDILGVTAVAVFVVSLWYWAFHLKDNPESIVAELATLGLIAGAVGIVVACAIRVFAWFADRK